VAGPVVEGACGSSGRSRTRVRGVAGSPSISESVTGVWGAAGCPSISESVTGVREHFAAAAALDLAALLALVITSFCDFVFEALSTRRRGQLWSSAGCGPPQWIHLAGQE
jgi:hypothetical protein